MGNNELFAVIGRRTPSNEKKDRERFKFRAVWIEYANTLPIDEAKDLCMAIISYALYKKKTPGPASSEKYYQSKILPELERDWRQWETSNISATM